MGNYSNRTKAYDWHAESNLKFRTIMQLTGIELMKFMAYNLLFQLTNVIYSELHSG